MRSSWQSTRRIGLAVACLAMIGVGFWLAQERCYVLRLCDAEGREVFSTELPCGVEFGIRFTHSVALSPVEEWFVAKDGKIALTRTVYQDFGAGLPHEPGPGQHMTVRDGYVEITGFTLLLSHMDVRVGRVAGHELLLPQAGRKNAYKVLPLSAWAPPGAALTFSLSKAPLWGWRNSS